MASPLVDVYVKLPTGRTSTVQLISSETVNSILEHVAKEEGVSAGRVRLKYQGKIIDKTKSIGYLGICPETILKGEVIVQKNITIYIKLPDGRCEPITVENTSSLTALKSRLEDKEGIKSGKQKLKVGGRTLEPPSRALFEFGVNEESVLELEEVKAEVSPHTESVKSQGASNEPDVSEEQKEEILSSFSSNGRNVEVVFSFDTTGSMYSCLTQVRQKLKESSRRLIRDIPQIRIGMIAHGDYCDYDNYVARCHDLTNDADDLANFAESVPATGGGDSPECYEWVLRKAQQMDWAEDSAKALVVIGDCEPHPPSYTDQGINWHQELDILKGMGIKVYGVKALSTTTSKPFYEELAARTGGCYLTLEHFDLITDMFLAVCYREAAPEQFDAFVEEVMQEGRMTGDTKIMLEKLEESPKQPENISTRYVKSAWWDPQLDTNSRPQYSYNEQEDKWRPTDVTDRINVNLRAEETLKRFSNPTTSPSASSSSTDRRMKRNRGKKCSIM